MKNALQSLRNWADQIKERISNLEGKNSEMRARANILKKSRISTRVISIDEKNMYLRINVLPEGEENKKGGQSILREIKAGNFPNLGIIVDIHVCETNRTPYSITAKRPPPGRTIIKLSSMIKTFNNSQAKKRLTNLH